MVWPCWLTAMHSRCLQSLLSVYCPRHATVRRNERPHRISSTADITTGLQSGSAELLRSTMNFFEHGQTRGRYHGGRRPSSDDSFHSPTVIPPPTLDKPSIMKRYHRRRTCSHTSPRRSPTMVTLHDTRFVECRWWSDGWTVKTVVT